MFYWPNLVLTDFEQQFVSKYEGARPGVKRRTYRALLNSHADASISELAQVHRVGKIQISRRSRVFALTFVGDVALWRLNIAKDNGDSFTAKNPGNNTSYDTAFAADVKVDAPIVAAMCPGSLYSPLSSLGAPRTQLSYLQPGDEPEPENLRLFNQVRYPLILDPCWLLNGNETLTLEGFPLSDSQVVLEVNAHVWEFPGMEQC